MDRALYAQVAFNLKVRKVFTYRVPDLLRMEVTPGRRVRVDFHSRRLVGTVVSISVETPKFEVKDILAVVDTGPRLTPEILRLCDWVAEYYRAPLGEVTAAAFPFPSNVTSRKRNYVHLGKPREVLESEMKAFPKRLKRRAAVLEYLLRAEKPPTIAELAASAGVGTGVVKSLIDEGYLALQAVEHLRDPFVTMDTFTYPIPELTSHQTHAVAEIVRDVHDRAASVFLLYGVTGSGKTEVYIRAIERVLHDGGSALVMVPEISLTPQAAERYRSRLGDGVGIFHSGLGAGERYDQWRECRRGNIRVLIGTRSGVFTPLENLRLVVIDEEHDASLKQVDPAPRYHGRDTAIVRAKQCGATVVLGSATPSLETYRNAETRKYRFLQLPERMSTHGLPQVRLVDMRGKGRGEGVLSLPLREAMGKRLDLGEQVILFLNRRGYFTSLICRRCGHVFMCENCSVALVYHHSRKKLLCHHCDYATDVPGICPHCRAGIFGERGFGTEQVVKEVETSFPRARIQRMDLDTTRRKGAHVDILSRFQKGEIDILVGTQMITKGLDIPNVTLVGIINADVALTIPDFRAGERTFGLLTQVAGRAGRGGTRGEVFIQTYCPDNYAVRFALSQDYLGFVEQEFRYRKQILFPPFSRIVNIRIESKTEDVAMEESRNLGRTLRDLVHSDAEMKEVRILGPAPCPFLKLRNWFRYQVTLQSASYQSIARLLGSQPVSEFVDKSHNLFKVVVDVDPISML